MLADHMTGRRAMGEATAVLATHTQKAPVGGLDPAARGRFAWGKFVKGLTRLYKHGGVSLMECVVPWVRVGAGDG